MTLALVPVKSFARAKTRLADALTPAERHTLADMLLADVLSVLHEVHGLERIAILSSDPIATRRAFDAECEIWHDPAPDLNSGLQTAARRCRQEGVESLLVLHADLPLLKSADIEALLAAAPPEPGVVLAPAPDGGTNAMLIRPPDALPFLFGTDSLVRHQHAAQYAGLAVRLIRLPGLTHDLDRPDDLRQIAALPGYSRTWRWLQQFVEGDLRDNHWIRCCA